ncbi:uncharacterized protein N7477_010107, partial [Penicillium maclennaniae]|uniref:uncharacterized protein n=1 Tax=Penicillium maclennaniae TaxID=1343394 RepID=UPI0025419978
LLQFIRENPLGLLITWDKSSQDFLQCTHVSCNKYNVFLFEDDVLVVSNGKYDYYVTPKYYTETKQDTRKVVPTWNYSVVQVYGKLPLYYDSKTPKAGSFPHK